MKQNIALCFFLVFLLPMAFAFLTVRPAGPEAAAPQSETVPEREEREVTVCVQKDGHSEQMPLDEYLLGVVLAEMPADFEMEALKAQAVVARTYTCRCIQSPRHGTAAVCIHSGCCQAYISVEDYLRKGGTQAQVDKLHTAVLQTRGQVLVYGSELIEATYFSCSGGRTEDAKAVWGNDVPYLQSVESPGEERAAHYTDTVTMDLTQFCQRLDIDSPEKVTLDRITYTNGGGVAQITLCGKVFTGVQVRNLLNLRSTAFVFSIVGDHVVITTKGFGHRVGMSQYGAEAMAVEGSTYPQILAYYYKGTELTTWFG